MWTTAGKRSYNDEAIDFSFIMHRNNVRDMLLYVAIIILKNWVRRFLAEQLVREEQKFDVVLALEVGQ